MSDAKIPRKNLVLKLFNHCAHCLNYFNINKTRMWQKLLGIQYMQVQCSKKSKLTLRNLAKIEPYP